jgi:hypothetical protein
MSITDQITVLLPCLTCATSASALCTTSLPFSFPRNATILRSSLVMAITRVRTLPSHGVFPCLKSGDYSSVFPSIAFCLVAEALQSPQSYGSRSTVRFQNPNGWEASLLSGLSTGRNYPVRHSVALKRILSETCRPSGHAVSIRGRAKRPVASIVRCLLSQETRCRVLCHDKPLSCIRSATVSHFYYWRGSSYFVFYLVLERCIDRRSC